MSGNVKLITKFKARIIVSVHTTNQYLSNFLGLSLYGTYIEN